MSPLVAEGLNLAVFGMGTVFVFLTLLVLATMLMSALVPVEAPVTPTSTPPGIDNTKKMAAIAAAIHQHRSRQQSG